MVLPALAAATRNLRMANANLLQAARLFKDGAEQKLEAKVTALSVEVTSIADQCSVAAAKTTAPPSKPKASRPAPPPPPAVPPGVNVG